MQKKITFFRAILLTLAAIISLPVGAAEQLTFDSSSTYGSKPVKLTGELRNSGSQKPLVILMHGCGGLEPIVRSSLRKHAARLNRAGFATFILDSFNPRGISGGWVCERISRLSSAQAYRQRDVKDAIAYLASQDLVDPSRVFVVGQSNGGSVASLIAHRPIKGVKAAVAFYPWCGAVPIRPKIPLLVLSGEDDDWTPPNECQKSAAKSKLLTVITYPGAVHSFDLDIPVQLFKGHKVGRNPQALADSRRRMVKFFQTHAN